MKSSTVKKGKNNGIAAGICFLAALFIIFSCVVASRNSVLAAEKKLPTKFVNDEAWYDEEIYYWTKINSVYFVPVTVFEKLDGVTVKENKYYKNIMISKGEKYLTIDTDTKTFAYTEEKGLYYFKSYLLRSNTLWVPAEQVCEYFGFKLEEKGEAVRISDSTTRKTLNDILKLYNPSLANDETAKETTQTTEAETTLPAETNENFAPQYEDIGNRLIYLTFEDGPNEYTDGILDLLKKYNIPATFFVTGGITDYPTAVSRMTAEGHSVGLHSMTCDSAFFARDINNFTSELETENNILYRIIKRKTRLVRAPDGSHSDAFVISEDEGKQLYDLGYIVWDWNVYIADGATPDEAFRAVVDGLIKYGVPVLRFSSNEATLSSLEGILRFIAGYDGFVCVPITEASAEVNFIGAY